ncbi:MAG: protein kinase family protein [Sulfuricaulis sp.]
MAALQELSLEQLRTHALKTFRHGGGSRPDVLLIRVNEEQAVLKDYTKTDPWFRRLVGPLSVRREARALRQLEGARGVPRLLRIVTREALLLEYIPGTSAREVPPGGLTPRFFDQFYRVVAGLHDFGIAHCDLRSQGNILVGFDGDPYVVDFAAHFRRGRSWNAVARWMYDKFCQADRVAVARLKKSHAPELLTEPEKQALARDRKTWLERSARFIGKSVRNISRWLLTRGNKSV